jgi:hypothetical protein
VDTLERGATFGDASSTVRALVAELDAHLDGSAVDAGSPGTTSAALRQIRDELAPVSRWFDEVAGAPSTTGAVQPRLSDAHLRAWLEAVADALPARDAGRYRQSLATAQGSALVVVGDLVAAGLTHEQLVSLFEGGHLLVPGHDLLERWRELDGARPRTSSHYRGQGQQYGLPGPFVHEVLFGPGPHDTTFVQLERAAPSHARHAEHIADWVEYKVTGDNEGPYGSSPDTDRHPMELDAAASMRTIATRAAALADAIGAEPTLAIVVKPTRDAAPGPPHDDDDRTAARGVAVLRDVAARLEKFVATSTGDS